MGKVQAQKSGTYMVTIPIDVVRVMKIKPGDVMTWQKTDKFNMNVRLTYKEDL
jgi:plastocyanin